MLTLSKLRFTLSTMPFNRKDHHNPGEIRPRFKLQSPLTEEEIFDRLGTFIKEDESVVGREVHNQFFIDIPQRERHFWSPELRVSAEKDEWADHDDTIIRVMVGPQYTVWVLFIFIYTFLGVVSLFGGDVWIVAVDYGSEIPMDLVLPGNCYPDPGSLCYCKIGTKERQGSNTSFSECCLSCVRS
jgi:hypothetical protein